MIGPTLGPYRLDRELGAGGMGRVWRAEVVGEAPGHVPGDVVAVKIVHPHLVGPGARGRFLREARVGLRVRHPNVVATFDSGEDQGHLWLAMEYVEGRTLRALFEELGRVPEALCRRLGRDAARGLAALHEAGAVHRDIKPENLVVTSGYDVKVMDLGVARIVDESVRLSQTGAFVGSLAYGAPEQFRGSEPVDARADLHALGVVLYEISTGSHPFGGGEIPSVIGRILSETPRRAADVHPELSLFFDETLARLLEKDRSRRFADAAELAAVLDEGEESSWWRERVRSIRRETKRPPRGFHVPRETGLHGRTAEMARLRRLFDDAKTGVGAAVVVEGEGGIGKSRLVDEFARGLWQDERVHLLFGEWISGAAAADAFAAAFHEHLGGDEGAALGVLAAAPLLAPAFAAFLRRDAPPQGAEPLTRESLQAALVHAMRSLAADRPTILVLDDLHLAPPEGRALFAALARAAAGHRVLLVATSRPDLDDRFVADLATLGAGRLVLPRLAADDLRDLLAEWSGSPRLAEDLASNIAAKCDGNPHFVFEVLRALRERFPPAEGRAPSIGTREIAEIPTPSSMRAAAEARLVGLADEERALLEVAACAGFEFDPVLVGAVVGLSAIRALQSLARIERRRRLVRSTGRGYVFDQRQVRDALYEAIPQAVRASRHAAIAATMESRSASTDPARRDGALCVELAGHFLNGGLAPRASPYLDAALTHLESTYAHERAVALADEALAAPGFVVGRSRCELLLRTAQRLEFLGRREDQEKALREALALADLEGDAALRSTSRSELGGCLCAVGRQEEAQRLFEESLSLCHEAGDVAGEATAWTRLGNVSWELGRYDEARIRQERSLALNREAGDLRGEAVATGNLGIALYALGRHEEARSLHQGALELQRRIGNRRGEATSTGNLGLAMLALGRYDEARSLQERKLALSRELGDRRGEAIAAGNLADLLDSLGRYDEALDHYRRLLALSREIGFRRGEAVTSLNLGNVYDALGRFDEARAQFQHAYELGGQIGDRATQARSLSDLGATLARAGLGADAAARLREAIPLGRELALPDVVLLATARLAALDRGDAVASALESLTTCSAAAIPAAAMEARLLLWRATRDRTHLAEARKMLDDLVAHAPPAHRDLMRSNVRLHREIDAATKEAGL